MTSLEFAEWQAFYRRRRGADDATDAASQHGKTPEQQLQYVEMLNKLFKGKDLRERTG